MNTLGFDFACSLGTCVYIHFSGRRQVVWVSADYVCSWLGAGASLPTREVEPPRLLSCSLAKEDFINPAGCTPSPSSQAQGGTGLECVYGVEGDTGVGEVLLHLLNLFISADGMWRNDAAPCRLHTLVWLHLRDTAKRGYAASEIVLRALTSTAL